MAPGSLSPRGSFAHSSPRAGVRPAACGASVDSRSEVGSAVTRGGGPGERRLGEGKGEEGGADPRRRGAAAPAAVVGAEPSAHPSPARGVPVPPSAAVAALAPSHDSAACGRRGSGTRRSPGTAAAAGGAERSSARGRAAARGDEEPAALRGQRAPLMRARGLRLLARYPPAACPPGTM